MKKIKKIIILLIVIPFLIFISSCESFLDFDITNDDKTEIIDFINDVETSAITKTVRVEAKYYKTNIDYANDNVSATSIGSGVIFKNIGSTYYVLTNNHVTSKKQYNKASGYIDFVKAKYSIYDAYNNSFSANVLYSDNEYDLSLMVFERGVKYENDNKLGVFEFDTSKLNTSSMLCAIGEALGQRNLIQVGYYKKSQEFIPNSESTLISNVTFNVIVHSAYINSGSSGGALINENMQLVGINFASASIESTEKFICTYAIPASKIKEFINDYEELS